MNPIVPEIGMSDPHVRVMGDAVYLYTGHDEHPDDRDWIMRDWKVYRSTDLRHWQEEATISPRDTPLMPDDSHHYWAADAAILPDRTLFYYSNRSHWISVMEGSTPTGPFREARESPLVEQHDPTVHLDADGQAYLIWGAKEVNYMIARLASDMISLAEEPRPLVIEGEAWENAPPWMDKNYLFHRNGRYVLSWGSDYAVADSIYGPYSCLGSFGEGYKLGPFAHGSFFEYRG